MSKENDTPPPAGYIPFPRPRHTFWLKDPDTGAITPNAFGKIYTYEAGSTVMKSVFDATRLMTHPNPVILDMCGSVQMYLSPNERYRLIIKTADDVVVEILDNVMDVSGR